MNQTHRTQKTRDSIVAHPFPPRERRPLQRKRVRIGVALFVCGAVLGAMGTVYVAAAGWLVGVGAILALVGVYVSGLLPFRRRDMRELYREHVA